MAHKLQLDNNDFEREYNRDFNELNKNVPDHTIFANAFDTDMGYVNVGEYDECALHYSIDKEGSITKVHPDGETDPTLSTYENILATQLMHGTYNTYIVSGAMGSGKTTTANRVMKSITDRIKARDGFVLTIEFNFNQNAFTDSDVATTEFFTMLYVKLWAALRRYLNEHHEQVDDFIRLLRENENVAGEFAHFDAFAYNPSVKNGDWNMVLNELKSTMDNVRGVDERRHLNEMFRFLGFINNNTPQQSFFVLFLDNIDSLPIYTQIDIIRFILSLNTISKVRCLVPVRRATFKRYAKRIDKMQLTSAHVFTAFAHHGHRPVKIILERINFWIKNIDSNKRTATIKPLHRHFIKQRLTYLQKELEIPDSRLAKFINCLSGRSTRYALSLCNRLIINNLVKYDLDPRNEYTIMKALMVNEKNIVHMPDPFITNIFRCGVVHDDFCLLPVRILQYVVKYANNDFKNDGRKLVEALKSFGIWSDQEVLSSLKKMSVVRKPLLYTNRLNSIETVRHLHELNDDNFYPTEIGENYYNYLLNDITYVQECLLPLTWNSERMFAKLDMQKEQARFETLLRGLELFLEEDTSQLDRSNTWKDTICEESVAANSILHISESVFAIFYNYLNIPVKVAFLVQWENLLVTVNKNPYVINKTKVNELLELFRNEIKKMENAIKANEYIRK